MEDEYQKTSELVYRQVLEQQNKLKNARPNSNSSFLNEYDKLKTTNLGGITFATLYTGGVLQTTHQQYKELYSKFYTSDICKGTILALTEICPNSIGVRCYFEFDYRSWVRLPTDLEMIEHIKMAQELIREAFPPNQQNDVTCHAAKCTPKIKFASASKKEKGKLAMGTHIVFAQIILNTQELRQLIATLDARITLKFPFFSGSVDAASVHTDSASLRPLYAYRLDQCDGCYPTRKKANQDTGKNNKSTSLTTTKYIENEKKWSGSSDLISLDKETYESDSEVDVPPLANELECKSEGCIKGKKFASPSIYKPWFILLEDGLSLDYYDEDSDDKKEWIEDMSIVPPFGLQCNKYNKPFDAIDTNNVIVKHGTSIIHRSEKSLFSSKLKTGVRFYPQSHTELLTVVGKIIQNFDPEHYSNITVSNALFTQRLCSMLVSVKNSKFCLLKDDCHGGNNIYFILKFKSKKKSKSEIRFVCHKTECDRILTQFRKSKATTKNKLVVQEEEIQITAKQKLLLFKTSKEIPFQLRKQVLNLLHIRDTEQRQEEIKEEESIPKLLYSISNDGDSSLPAKYVYDPRIAMMVIEKELSLPIPTKKRNVEELGCSYEQKVIKKIDEIPIIKETTRQEKEQTLDFYLDDLLKSDW